MSALRTLPFGSSERSKCKRIEEGNNVWRRKICDRRQVVGRMGGFVVASEDDLVDHQCWPQLSIRADDFDY